MDTLDHEEMKSATLDDAFSDLVTVKLDSCHSTWYFQPVRMRFRRELKGIGMPGVSTGWRPYYGLRFDDDSDGFTVFLNREGTRLLTSWCHPAGADVCANCAEHRAERSASDVICQLV